MGRWLLLAFLVACSSREPTYFRSGPLWVECEIPFRVVVLDAILWSTYKDSLTEAVSMWNDRVQCSVFEVVDSGPVDVLVVFGEVDVNWPNRIAVVDFDDVPGTSRKVAVVKIIKPFDIRSEMFILAHELGHVLGLDHDRIEFSIMHPMVVNYVNRPPRITDNDARAVKTRYCDCSRSAYDFVGWFFAKRD